MTAFLKIDQCAGCKRAIPWEWTPAILLAGKPLPGTGVWRSQLMDGQCPPCLTAKDSERENARAAERMRRSLLELLGGPKPFEEFTFERYEVTPGNRHAFDTSKQFNPAIENLYLWGPCGVGKSHLAFAVARHCFQEMLTVRILRSWQLSRCVRMKDPEQEQSAIDELVRTDVFVLDDLGNGSDTPYSRQILQEILDERAFRRRSGIVLTSKFSLGGLAQKMNDDTITSRLAGMFTVIEVKGSDYRLRRRTN